MTSYTSSSLGLGQYILIEGLYVPTMNIGSHVTTLCPEIFYISTKIHLKKKRTSTVY